MDSHVTGGRTPQGLAKLRLAIYALIGDQLLFSEAEQLQLSLTAHECEDARQLRAELARLQGEVDRRLRVLWLQQQASDQPEAVFADYATQHADVRTLAYFPALHPSMRRALPGLHALSGPAARLEVVGDAYQMILEYRGLLSQVLN